MLALCSVCLLVLQPLPPAPRPAPPPDPSLPILRSAQAAQEPNAWPEIVAIIPHFLRNQELGSDLADAARGPVPSPAALGLLASFDALHLTRHLDALAASRHVLGPGLTGDVSLSRHASSAMLFASYASVARLRHAQAPDDRIRGLRHALALARHAALQGSYSDVVTSGIILELVHRALLDRLRAGVPEPELLLYLDAAKRQRLEAPRALWFDAELASARVLVADELTSLDDPRAGIVTRSMIPEAHAALDGHFAAAKRREFPPLASLPVPARDAVLQVLHDQPLCSANLDRVLAISEGLPAVVALAIIAARGDPPPASLNDLIPDLLDRLPIDPATDSPPVFRPSPTLLYSVGTDGIDHNANADPGLPRRAFTPRGVGYDYILYP